MKLANGYTPLVWGLRPGGVGERLVIGVVLARIPGGFVVWGCAADHPSDAFECFGGDYFNQTRGRPSLAPEADDVFDVFHGALETWRDRAHVYGIHAAHPEGPLAEFLRGY